MSFFSASSSLTPMAKVSSDTRIWRARVNMRFSPADNTDEVGLREVINDEEVEEVFAVLRKKEARMPTNWSRRYKNHVEKLKSGDIYQVAEVVRNLSIREKDKGLSAGEKRMLTRARQILVSELTFAIGVSEQEAEKKLNDALP